MRTRRHSPQTIAILVHLAERVGHWSHGYDVCRALGLKPGTVYPVLIRLADRGLVETAWQQDAPRGRPPRHLYRLSHEGAALAARLQAPPEPTTAPQVAVPARRPRLTASEA